MAKTPRQRQQEHRDRLKAAGYRGLTVYLPGPTFEALERLKAGRAGTDAERLAAVIAEAVEALDRQQQTSTPTRHQSRNPSRPSVTSDAPPSGSGERAALVAEALNLKGKGWGPTAIADRLNARGWTTTKGRAWDRRSVDRLLRRAAGAG